MFSKGNTPSGSRVASPVPPADTRLESWKEIAAYLKRDISTVQRWERKEGLPVHRQMHDKLGTVYAFTEELDAWRNNGKLVAHEVAPDIGQHKPWLWAVRAGVTAAVLVAGAAAISRWLTPAAPTILEDVLHMQVTTSGDVLAASISPDGRSVAYAVEQDHGIALLVQDISGGQAVKIWRGDHIEDVKWMPDNTRVLVSGAQGGHQAVWLLPRLGGSARQVALGLAYVAPSPDGAEIAMAHQAGQEVRFVRTSDGAVRRAAVGGFRWLYQLEWSKRTNRVAMLTSTDENEWIVWSLGADAFDARRIFGSKDLLHGICWSSASDALYLLRERNETTDVVRITADGRDSTIANVVAAGLRLASLHGRNACSVSEGNWRLLHVRRFGYANLWRLDLRGSGSPATPLTVGTAAFGAPAISPDGQWIVAARSLAARGTSVSLTAQATLVKIPISGGEPVPLATGTSPAWSPDRRLAYISSASGSPRVWVSNADGREAIELKDSTVGSRVSWLLDGRLAWQLPGNRDYRIRDLSTGREESLVKDPSVGFVFDPLVSPRGDLVALWWNRRQTGGRGFWLLSWPDRTNERFVSPNLAPIGWTLDGTAIYAFESPGRAVKRWSLTGELREVGSFPSGSIYQCALTPTHSSVICSVEETKSDVWVIENFDAPGARLAG